MLTIKADSKIGVVLRAIPKRAGQILTRAVNKTAVWARTRTARAVAAGKRIPVGRVRAKLALTRARSRNFIAVIQARRPWIKAIEAGAMRQSKIGVVGRGHKFRRAFLATMPAGNRGVYLRKPKAGRLPIQEVLIHFGKQVEDEMQGLTRGPLPRRLRFEIDRQIGLLFD